MNHIRTNPTSRQRRRAGTTLVLAAASGGLLAAAMAGSPTARADDPFTDILTDVQASITAGEGDFSTAATDLSTAGDTNEGLLALFAGFDNSVVSSADYVFVGLVDAATGTDASGLDGDFLVSDVGQPLTAAGQEAIAQTDMTDGATYTSDALTYLSSGDYADAALAGAFGSYYTDVLLPEADLLATLFGAGI
jgi:hypothetical protein